MTARKDLSMRNDIMKTSCWLMAIAGALVLEISANANEHTKDTLTTVKEKLAKGKAVLVDVREKFEWEDGHLKAAVLVPLSELREGKNDEEFAKALAKKLPRIQGHHLVLNLLVIRLMNYVELLGQVVKRLYD